MADWLINCKVVEETDKELYSYAVYSILLSLSPLALAIGLGICMGCVGRSIMIIIPFAIIRKFCIKCGWKIALINDQKRAKNVVSCKKG
ncbi:accessory gene regulator B family protein [Parablautia intestinalis]|uniref:accessory gene regulator B family protein n=1 Tax=Parablautia intestinalis TaxID=2320100 RepID=UPI002412E246|nr:accessory gene regulator B family protein [Parablautia intestinalis]